MVNKCIMTEGQHLTAALTAEAVGRNYFRLIFCLLSAEQFQPEQTDRIESSPCRGTVFCFTAMSITCVCNILMKVGWEPGLSGCLG